MSMKSLVICFFMLFCVLSYSQETTIDSLKKVLNHSKNDIDKAELLNAIASEYMSSDPKQMGDYANKALELSKKIKHRIEEGNSYLNLGNVNVILGNYPLALDNFSNAQEIFEADLITDLKNSSEIKKGLARAYGSIGIVFSEQSNYAKALQYHLKAVKIYEEMKDEARTARIYNNIGIVYQAIKEDFKALDYFTKAQKLQEKTGDMTVGITTTNIGNIYLRQKNYPKALEYYTKSKNTFAKSSDARGLGELYNNLGSYYWQTGNSSQALESWKKAIAQFNSIDDKFGISDTYSHLGNFYFNHKKYNEALGNATNALKLAKELDVLEQVMNSEKLISSIYEKQNKLDLALQHYRYYNVARDSLISHENIRKSVQAEMNFDFEKKQTIQQEAHEKRELLYKEQNKRYQLQTIFGALFGILIFGIIFLIYNRMQLKKTLTLQKELAEYEQKALHLQMNPHFVFNCLGSISSFIVQNGTDSAIKYLSKFSKLMRLTLEYSKESLIPIDKEIESLQNYLELEQLRSDKMFNFSITKSDQIEDDMALPPLLLQPFVENAIIHGLIPKKEVGKIDIDFSLKEESLICMIVDNGIGFEKSQELKAASVSIHKSMALDITRKRLEMMGAVTSKTSKVEIKELKDENGKPIGTEVILYLPIQYIK
ncbi:tetratricopeptide (TPR) repeat protein [Flavobacterium sp. 28YEA47A]|uniref:tetratricopeptide repeat-containing sensor histidine kinase n=1 Tax=Flavobacterium sp. 28YEA47A TaxID=3156276 RepID=UPI0035188FA7